MRQKSYFLGTKSSSLFLFIGSILITVWSLDSLRRISFMGWEILAGLN